MNRHFSTLALSALALVAVGGLTLLGTGLVAEAARRDWTPLVSTNYPVSGSFTDIAITDYYADVQLRPSRNGTISVTTRDAEGVSRDVSVAGGTLTITRAEPSVGERIFHHEDDDPTVILYLPAGNYGALTVSTTSGDVEASAQLNFSAVNLTTVSGDIELGGSVSGNVVCNTTSGDVELYCPTAGAVQINTTSGDAELTGCYAESVAVLSTSGDTDLEHTIVSGAVTVDTTSGDIDLERSDAASLTLSTVSGEVEGTLLSAKNFSVSSTMGRVSVPASNPSAGPCNVSTTSGDVRLAVRP